VVFSQELAWKLIGLGIIAVLCGSLVGYLANAMGAEGALIGVGATQITLLVAFFNARLLGLPELNFKEGCIFGGLCAGAMAVFVCGGLAQLLEVFGFSPQPQPIIEQLRVAGGLELPMMALLGVFLGPIVEEIYFRGWWLKLLERKLGALTSVFVLAIVFALLHFSIGAFAGLFVLGVLLGFAALRWGIISAIIGHMLFNLITFLAVRGGWV